MASNSKKNGASFEKKADRVMDRTAAMQLIYAGMLGGDSGELTLQGVLEFPSPEEIEARNEAAEGEPEEKLPETYIPDRGYILSTVRGVLDNTDMLDEHIEKYLVRWSIDRLPRVELAILRLAAYEILCNEEIPNAVAVNEAIELTKTFSAEESGSYINGVLGSLLREIEK